MLQKIKTADVGSIITKPPWRLASATPPINRPLSFLQHHIFVIASSARGDSMFPFSSLPVYSLYRKLITFILALVLGFAKYFYEDSMHYIQVAKHKTPKGLENISCSFIIIRIKGGQSVSLSVITIHICFYRDYIDFNLSLPYQLSIMVSIAN